MLAVIPARGGSKGIPGKNSRKVSNKPLIEHAIIACMEAEKIDRVAVSTDCEIIAVIAYECGAEVVDRPDEISTGTASSELAVLHAIETLGWDGDNTVMVQCTSPLTKGYDIDAVIDLLDMGYDSVFTACKFHGFVWENGEPVGHSSATRMMRQETNRYLENGAVYGFLTDKFVEHKHRFFGSIGMHVMPRARSIEIDDPHDLIIAETLMNKNAHVNSGEDT